MRQQDSLIYLIAVLIDGLNKASVEVDRKVLADLAVNDIDTFGKLAERAKASLSG